jgi:hypothetical protein
MKRFFWLVILLLITCKSFGQGIPPTSLPNPNNVLNAKNLPPAGVGAWTRKSEFKQLMTQPQLSWVTPCEITYTAHTGSSVAGETITGSTSGATGILVKDTGTVLMIRVLTGTFQAQELVTGNGGGSLAVTAVTASSFQPPTQYVWSGYLNHTGILATNGMAQRRGGTTVSQSYTSTPTLFGTGSGIFLINLGTRAVITYSAESGGFTLGETVNQATSAAQGCVYYDNNSNTLKIEVISGTFDNSHGVVNTSNVNFLEWSPDGWTNFATVQDVDNTAGATTPQFQAMTDCGVIAGSVNSKTNSRIVLWCDYGEGNCSLRYCQPDINPYTWYTIFTADGTNGTTGSWPYNGSTGSDQSIRHFHGASFITGIGAKEGRLFLRSGDQDFQCGWYICDDIANLCNNGSTWKTNWGMDCCGPCRIFWFNQTATTQATITVTGVSGTPDKGEQVSAGGAIGFIKSISGGTWTVYVASGTFPTSGTITCTTSTATATITGSSTTTIGGGKNYTIGNNAVQGLTILGYPSLATGNYNSTGSQGVGGQDCRSVDLIVDANKQYGYYIPDQPGAYSAAGAFPAYDGYGLANGANNLRKIDLVNKTVTTINGYRATGTGWMGCLAPDGVTPLITTESDHTNPANGGSYYLNCDAYDRIYAVGPDGASLYEVARFLRKDYLAPAQSPTTLSAVFVAFGALWCWDAQKNLFDGDPIGDFTTKPKVWVTDQTVNSYGAQPTPPIDLIEGGRWQQGATDTANWKSNNMTHFTIVTSYFDADEGQTQSVQADCTGGGGTCYAQYQWNFQTVYGLRGKWVTFRVRVKAPVSLSASQAPYIQWLTGTGDVVSVPIPFSDNWQTITGSIWIPATEQTLYLRIIPDLTNTYTGSIFVGSVSVAEGATFPQGNLIPKNLASGTLNLSQYGLQQIAVSTADITVTQLNLYASIIELTGSPAAGHNIIFPTTSGTNGTQKGMRFSINNLTGQAMTIKYNGATGFSLAASTTCLCYFNGTDMVKL